MSRYLAHRRLEEPPSGPCRFQSVAWEAAQGVLDGLFAWD
jgi:hypothetical protein